MYRVEGRRSRSGSGVGVTVRAWFRKSCTVKVRFKAEIRL
jgi:hypothetical protein